MSKSPAEQARTEVEEWLGQDVDSMWSHDVLEAWRASDAPNFDKLVARLTPIFEQAQFNRFQKSQWDGLHAKCDALRERAERAEAKQHAIRDELNQRDATIIDLRAALEIAEKAAEADVARLREALRTCIAYLPTEMREYAGEALSETEPKR